MIENRMTLVAASGDAELVSASLTGDREAFGQLVSRYQSLICSLAYSATGSLSQSEDLAQETFIAAWKDLAALREPAKLRSWLCGIARNLINSSLRAQGREPSHRAETLEVIDEPHSPEPSPVERAISREEADILWRSLERIPETYRVPLVLFYREHQSIEAVAQNLELTEDAVKQRLSRGRSLLQEEVLAFVEVALERTSPGRTFTLGVVAALPLAATSATAASAGALAVAKGGAGTKSILGLGALGGFMTVLGAFAYMLKMTVDDAKSPRERKFTARMAWGQFAFLVISSVAGFYGIPRLSARPWAFGMAFALLIVANVAFGLVLLTCGVWRRVEIGMQEGTWADSLRGDPEGLTRAKTVPRAIKLTIPFVVLLGVGSVTLPWKTHWLRSTVVVGAQVLVVIWYFRQIQRPLSSQMSMRWISRLPVSLRNPFILLPVLLLGSGLLGALQGYLLPYFLHPGATKAGLAFPEWLGPLGVCLLIAGLGYALLVALWARRSKIATPGEWFPGKLLLPFLQNLSTIVKGPNAVAELTYAPLFDQLQLGPERRAHLKDLVLKRTQVGVLASVSLMKSKLDPAKHAAVLSAMKRDTDRFNLQIKEFLGVESNAVFQRFEKTIPDRTMLNLFSRQLSKTALKLSSEQETRLLQGLSDARARYPWTTELSRRNQPISDYAEAFNEVNVATSAQEEEQFDAEFLAQAQTLLSSEQLRAFGQFQARQRQSQAAQIQFAARLFALRRG